MRLKVSARFVRSFLGFEIENPKHLPSDLPGARLEEEALAEGQVVLRLYGGFAKNWQFLLVFSKTIVHSQSLVYRSLRTAAENP